MSGQSALQKTTPRVPTPTTFQINAQTLRASRARPIRPQETLVTTFGAGHGWTGNNATDTDTGGWDSQCVRVVTNGAGGGGNVNSPALTAFNPVGKTFEIKVKVADWSKLSVLELWLGQDSGFVNATRYQIASQSALPPYSNAEWATLTICAQPIATVGTGAGAAPTFARLRCVDNGTGAVDVRWGGFAYYTPAAFPNGVVTFTFDDGFSSHWSIAKPYMNKYRYRATVLPILSLLDTSGRLTTDNLTQLNAEGWEVGSHASTDAIHTLGLTGLTIAQAEAELQTCKAYLIANGFKSETFAYPQSLSNSAVQALTSRYYQFARSGGFGGVYETLPAAKLPSIRSYTVGSTTSLSAMQQLIQDAYTYGFHLVFLVHDILASGATGNYQVLTATFQAMVDKCATVGVPVLPLSDVYSKLV